MAVRSCGSWERRATLPQAAVGRGKGQNKALAGARNAGDEPTDRRPPQERHAVGGSTATATATACTPSPSRPPEKGGWR